MLSNDWTTPSSFAIWSGSSGNRARLAFAIARRITRDPLWVQIEEPAKPREPEETEVLAQLSPNSLFVRNPSELRLRPVVGRVESLLRRDDEATEVWLRRFGRVLELPDVVQWILESPSSSQLVRAIVVAHTELLRDGWPTSAGSMRPFLQVARDYRVSMIFALGAPPEPSVLDAEYVLRLEDLPHERPASVRVICDQGAPRNSAGLFVKGSTHGLTELVESLQPP